MKTKLQRDLSRAQFIAKAKALGFAPEFMGYWKLPTPNEYVSICSLNGGKRFRDRLAYLVAANARHIASGEKASDLVTKIEAR